MSPDNLKNILDSVRSMPDLLPEGETTHCNEAVRRSFALSGFPKVFAKNEMANAIIDQLKQPNNGFREVGTIEAWKAAQEGELVIAGHKYTTHGHVAMVYPSDEMKHSASWDKDVPLVSNIGKTNMIMKVSDAFPVALGEPNYFAFKG